MIARRVRHAHSYLELPLCNSKPLTVDKGTVDRRKDNFRYSDMYFNIDTFISHVIHRV